VGARRRTGKDIILHPQRSVGRNTAKGASEIALACGTEVIETGRS